jgi:serine/threonine-protein kinase RsbW
MATVTLRLTPQRAHVRTARLVAVAMARHSGVPEELLDEVRLAVGEACGRAVQLHERHGLTEPVVVTLADDDDRFEVVVRDLAPSKAGSDGAVGGSGGDDAGPAHQPPAHQPPVRHSDAPGRPPTDGPQPAGRGTGRAAAEVPDWQAPLDAGFDLVLLAALVEALSVEAVDGVGGTEVRMSWSLDHPAAGSGR